MDWADKFAASDKGSHYTQHKFEEVVPGNCVAVNFEALFISADHIDQKAIVLFPIQFITILTQLLASREALLPWEFGFAFYSW